MQAPPSRYRVVERGGRLVVLDSAVGGAPATVRELLSGMASEEPFSPELSLDQYARVEAVAVADAPAVAAPSPRSTAYEAPGAAQSVAETVTGNSRDDRGRLLLTTARWYDAKAPRTLVLSEAGERQFGGVVIALLAGVVVAIFLAIMTDVFGWVIVVAVIVLLSRAKPVATLWLDRLETV